MSGKQIELASGYVLHEPARDGDGWRVTYGGLDTGLRITEVTGHPGTGDYLERTIRDIVGSPQPMGEQAAMIGHHRSSKHPTCLNCGHTHYYDMDGDSGDAIGNPTGSCRLGCGCQLARYAPTAGI